jgi:hypothetical protein
MAFKVLFGGRIRPSFGTGTAYGEGHVWEQGDVLTLTAASVLTSAVSKNSVPMGIACEYRRSATDDQTGGGNVGSIILDPAIIKSDRFASGAYGSADAAIGDKVYVNDAGEIVFTDPTSGTVIGTVLEVVDTDGFVTWLFDPQY